MLEKKLDSLLRKSCAEFGLNWALDFSSRRLIKHEAYHEADLLNIHSNFGRFFSYLRLPTITRNKPTILILHDMWAYTGHCHYSYDCERWKSGCGECPYPDVYEPIKRDGTALEWKLKDWAYSHSDLTIVCPSKWIAEQAKHSSLMNRFPIHYIPYGINCETFQPLDPEQCRLELGIPLGKKVLMFAAANLNDYRKGSDLLIKALQSLPESLKAETALLVIGKGGPAIAEAINIPVYDLGYLSDDQRKAVAYSAADLFLFPTRADVFGLVSIESQACGTPVVSFRVGGVPEHVRSGITGYLAEPEDAKDFSDGIVQLLEDQNLHNYMAQQSRTIAVGEFATEVQVQQYIGLYQHLLQKDTFPPSDAGKQRQDASAPLV